MVEMRPLANIKRILVSIMFFFCLLSHPGLSGESFQDQVVEACYPDSLNEIRDFHDEFLHPSSNTKSGLSEDIEEIDIFNEDDVRLQSEIISPKVDPESILRRDRDLKMEIPDSQGTVAVNTKKQTTMVLGGPLEDGAEGANVMNIEVAHITVIAINTARGGEAIATSEIYIQPTQDMGAASIAAEG
jgi:hypothetical protein